MGIVPIYIPDMQPTLRMGQTNPEPPPFDDSDYDDEIAATAILDLIMESQDG